MTDKDVQQHNLDNISSKLEASEIEAQQRLIKSGVLEELKAIHVYIWAMNAVYTNEEQVRLDMSVDVTLNPDLPFDKVKEIIKVVLEPMQVEVHLERLSIRDFCCYGQCKGCLNGNPEAQPIWVGRFFN